MACFVGDRRNSGAGKALLPFRLFSAPTAPFRAFIVALAATWVTVLAGCGGIPGLILPNESTAPVDTRRFQLLARFVQISDAQIVDEQSPGRLASLAALFPSAWRPQEAYSLQLLDGTIRAVNKMHVAQSPIDFLIHTGDATDNAQLNELQWFVAVLDGGRIDPRSGPDDRDPASHPPPLMDPHHPFAAQGLYRTGVHGEAPTIFWYSLVGNHDHFASGVFPIVANLFGRRTSPLLLPNRIGLFLPVALDPTGTTAWGLISPAHPGPPVELSFPVLVAGRAERRFITNEEFIDLHLSSTSHPPGHGFDAEAPQRTWYSVRPIPGLRLIGLNSSSPWHEEPAGIYSEGAISAPQVRFLRQELNLATDRGECVIVATHHPSGSLDPFYGTSLTQFSMHRLLSGYPCVKLHVAGHLHRNVVIDRGSYHEIVTGSIVDAPQQGRIIEIWRDATGESELRYWMFSHLDDVAPPDSERLSLFDDPLLPMRRVAAELAGVALPDSER